MGVTVRNIQPGDERGVVELLILVFGGWPHLDISCSSLEYWRWKYEGRTSLGKFIVLAETEDGELVGCLHTIPVEFKGVHGVERCAIGMDLAVHPGYRGRGISGMLSKAINESLHEVGFRFSYQITSHPRVISRVIKTHMCFNGRILNYVRVVDVDRQLEAMPMKRGWMVKAGYEILRGFNRVMNSLGPRVSQGRLSVVEDTGFGVEADALWDKVSPYYSFMLKRDPVYLNWRYCDSRVGGYEIRKAYEEGVLLGYCVFRANRFREEYPVGYVLDLVAVPGRVDVACSLIREAVRYFDDAGVNVVNVMVMEGAWFIDALRLNGFLNSRVKLNVYLDTFGDADLVRNLVDLEPGRVLVSWGDHDAMPVQMPEVF
jgi:GNAT superfamily N-acetyltransferase